MPYIKLEKHLPGITGLLEYRKDAAVPIRELTQVLLRGPSTLSVAERELLATIVSLDNQCQFCSTAHRTVTTRLFDDEEVVEKVKNDVDSAPVTEKMKQLVKIARLVTKGGKFVTPDAIKNAKQAGATDIEIHDTVLIAGLFCLYNRYVDGLATQLPEDPTYYNDLGDRLIDKGYVRIPEAYEKLKEKNKSK